MTPERQKKLRPPLDREALERLALAYVGRYSTTRSRLNAYLTRKVRERGWDGEKAADIDALVERIERLGYVDDRAFASARAVSLMRRGYGERRIGQALHAAGIAPHDAVEAQGEVRDGALAAALRFARRKKIGPFAVQEADRAAKQKAFAAMMRAGHSLEIARQVLNCDAGEFPECDIV